jgi:hypothetical protein
MGIILVATFAGLVLIRLVAILVIAFFVIRPIEACPACFATETFPIKRKLLWLLGRRYEWRWCPHCGWQALVGATVQRPQIKEARSN